MSRYFSDFVQVRDVNRDTGWSETQLHRGVGGLYRKEEDNWNNGEKRQLDNWERLRSCTVTLLSKGLVCLLWIRVNSSSYLVHLFSVFIAHLDLSLSLHSRHTHRISFGSALECPDEPRQKQYGLIQSKQKLLRLPASANFSISDPPPKSAHTPGTVTPNVSSWEHKWQTFHYLLPEILRANASEED